MINWIKLKFLNNKKQAKYRSFLSTYVRTYDSIISNGLCDRIISYTHTNANKWIAIDRPTDFCLGMRIDPISPLDKEVCSIVNTTINQYMKDCPGVSIKKDMGYELTLHDKQNYMKLQYMQAQALMFMFLTDHEENEGALIFPHQDLIIKAKKGRIVIFPGNFLFPFKSMELKNKQRYMLFTMLN